MMVALLLGLTLMANVSSPQQAGSNVLFTSTTDRTNVEYKYWIQDQSDGVWKVGQNWNTGRFWNWVPPRNGTYVIGSWIRPIGKTSDWYEEASNRITFLIGDLPPQPSRLPSLLVPQGVCTPVQITANGTMPPNTNTASAASGVLRLADTAQYIPHGYRFPAEVPSGYYFGITRVHWASKYIAAAGRSSYFILYGTMTVPEHMDSPPTFWPPVTLPPNFVLDGQFSNSSSEAQNVNAVVTGYLSSDSTFANCPR